MLSISQLAMIGFRTAVSPSVSNKSSVTTTSDELAIIPVQNSPLRTLNDVRNQVSQEIAINTITKAEYMDGVRIGVRLVMSNGNDEDFLRQIAGNIRHQLTLLDHLFAVASTTQSTTSTPNTLIICGSSVDVVQRAMLLTSSKFTGRMVTATGNEEPDVVWVATISDLGVSPYDEDALWDVMRKSARSPMDPLAPPPGSRSIDSILSEARSKLQRISVSQAFDELRETQVGAPTFLVDIRPAAQREREGAIHGSLIIERNVLEWRFDPRCPSRLAIADRYDLRIIVFCQEGYSSSLAAYSLQQLGLLNATDMVGGYESWKSAGFPIDLDRSLVSRASSAV